jgi:hypothetical protein
MEYWLIKKISKKNYLNFDKKSVWNPEYSQILLLESIIIDKNKKYLFIKKNKRLDKF